MTDEQLEIIKKGMENGVTLRQTILDEGWVEEISPETVVPFAKAFKEKYGIKEFNRLRRLANPPITTGIQNATQAANRAIRAALRREKLFVDERTRKKRLKICYSCPLLNDSSCSKCGCNVKKKTRLSTEKCPKDKW